MAGLYGRAVAYAGTVPASIPVLQGEALDGGRHAIVHFQSPAPSAESVDDGHAILLRKAVRRLENTAL